MNPEKRWKKLQELGAGGQGRVFRVLDIRKASLDHANFFNAITARFRGAPGKKEMSERYESFKKAVLEIFENADPSNHGALKILHEPGAARDPLLAEERIKREINAMASIKHPNLLRILDHDPDFRWYVSRFYPDGTLEDNSARFNGDLLGALRAFRPLVEGVGKLHESGQVHRDIKPANVFIGDEGQLTLGDFGLVFSGDPSCTRISATYENVGSRAWMPIWATEMRTEEVKPNFDVFSLGKVLWSMLSSKPILTAWYYSDPEYPQLDVERQFPRAQYMHLANQIFSKCLVERPAACLPDAGALLELIDDILEAIGAGADFIDESNVNAPNRRCRACGLGHYQHKPGSSFAEDLGLRLRKGTDVKIFQCPRCGNVQFFASAPSGSPEIWP